VSNNEPVRNPTVYGGRIKNGNIIKAEDDRRIDAPPVKLQVPRSKRVTVIYVRASKPKESIQETFRKAFDI